MNIVKQPNESVWKSLKIIGKELLKILLIMSRSKKD